jgi:hypothetical protein
LSRPMAVNCKPAGQGRRMALYRAESIEPGTVH